MSNRFAARGAGLGVHAATPKAAVSETPARAISFCARESEPILAVVYLGVALVAGAGLLAWALLSAVVL